MINSEAAALTDDGSQCGGDGGGPGLLQMAVFLGFLPWPVYILYILYVVKKRLGALMTKSPDKSKASAAGMTKDEKAMMAGELEAEQSDEEDKDGEVEEEEEEVLNDFLDDVYTRGLDDHETLEVNPVMTYKMNLAKKRARQAARAAQLGVDVDEMIAADTASGTGGGGGGRPGGLARLGWKLNKKGDAAGLSKNISAEVKGIEMYLSRDEGVDTKLRKEEEHHVAGEATLHPSLLAVAQSTEHQSNIGRMGGRRGSTIATAAQQGRKQLAQLKDSKPALFQTEADLAYRKAMQDK